MALRARAREHHLALLLELGQATVRIRQRCGAGTDGVRERADTAIREQHALKRGEVVEELLRRRALDLRVVGERAKRLLLKRRHAAIQLVSAERIRQTCPRVGAVGSRQGDVVDRRHHAPHVH